MTADELTRSLQRGAARAHRFRKPLVAAYASELRAARDRAVENLRSYAIEHPVAAAAWTKPDVDEIYRLAKAIGDMQKSTDGIRIEAMRAQVAETLAVLGITFDVKNPLIKGVLDQAGQKIVDIAESQRQEIMALVNYAWENGLDMDATAALIRDRSSIAGLTRAMRIARTEIVSVQNGGALAAAKLTGVANTKVWLTSAGARHPRHHGYNGLDGQQRPLKDLFNVGGYLLEYPGDFGGPAREVVNCRCTLAYKET